jgi:hypothetical protein
MLLPQRFLKPHFIKEIGNIIADYVGSLLTFSFSPEEINEAFFVDYASKKEKEEDQKENGNGHEYVAWIGYQYLVDGPVPIFDSVKENYHFRDYYSFRDDYLHKIGKVEGSSIFVNQDYGDSECPLSGENLKIEITNQHWAGKRIFKSTPIIYHLDSFHLCHHTMTWEELFVIIHTRVTSKPMQIQSIDIVYEDETKNGDDKFSGDKFTDDNKFTLKVLMTEEELISINY